MKHFFIDANIFIYFATDEEKYADSCQELFEGTIEGKVRSFTSALVLNEVLHKLMTLEIADKKDIPPHKVMSNIRDDSSILDEVNEAWKDLVRILKIDNLTVLETDLNTLVMGSNIAKDKNLLITDSMHLATMNIYGIDIMATTDDRIKESKMVEVWDPLEDDLKEYLVK